jgi:hypothetical protein
MRQAVKTVIAVSFLGLGPLCAAAASGEASDEAESIAQARRLIDAQDHASAMVVLEDLLIEAQPKEKPAIVKLLRQTYLVLARQAQAGGRQREAAHYRDNLEILNLGQSRMNPPDSAAPGIKQGPILRTGLNPPDEEPTKAAPRAQVQPQGRPAPAQPAKSRALPDAVPVPLDEPRPLAEPPVVRAPLPPRAAPRDRAASDSSNSGPAHGQSSPEAVKLEPDRDRGNRQVTVQPSAQPAPVTAATGPKAVGQSSVEPARPLAGTAAADADRFFSSKKYIEAGKCYAALASENRLPENRKNHWAYCRMVDVATRMNARPSSSAQWDQIQAEIESIQQLAPQLWYAEYLRNKFAEVRKVVRRPRSASDNLIVRGSAPEEGQDGSKSQPRRLPKLFAKSNNTDAPAKPQPASEEDVARAGQRAPASQGVAWQVLETANFRIFHCDGRLAESVGETAESIRAEQGKRWGSSAAERPWNPRCELLLYPTGKEFAQGTGQPETAPGFSTMFTSGNRVTGRRTSLRADHPQLLKAILPHEVTHVVLADLFTVQQIPRWADEGIAVLAEPPAEQTLRAAELREALESNHVFDLSKLMAMDYPDAKDWSVYYAQSISLTRFLVEQGTPQQFIQFVRDLPRTGAEGGLRDRYGINGFAELHDRWRAFAREQLAQLDQPRPAPDNKLSTAAAH